MATISLHIGQCGNQLGTEVFLSLAEEAKRANENPSYQQQISDNFFRPPERKTKTTTYSGVGKRKGGDVMEMGAPPTARCVMIDMEPKAVQQCIQTAEASGLFTFSSSQAVTKNEGSANNWAFGFHVQGPTRAQEIESAVFKEMECCDSISSFQLCHSVAGGTGSGVGCYVGTLLRDICPQAIISHSIVWPFSQGEVMTQWYNCILSLHHLTETADSVFVCSNEDTANQLKRITMSSTNAASMISPSFHDLNHVMASQISGLQLPSRLTSWSFGPSSKRRSSSNSPQGIKKNYPSSAYSALRFPLAAQSRMLAGEPQIDPEDNEDFQNYHSLHSTTWCDVLEATALDPSRKYFQCSCVPLFSTSSNSSSSSTIVQKYQQRNYPLQAPVESVGASSPSQTQVQAERVGGRGSHLFTAKNGAPSSLSTTSSSSTFNNMQKIGSQQSSVVPPPSSTQGMFGENFQSQQFSHTNIVEEVNVTWASILPEILRTASRSAMDCGFLTLRGPYALETGLPDLHEALVQCPLPQLSSVATSNVPFQGHTSYATLYHNSDKSFFPKLECCAEKVEAMLEAGAFLHHFSRYGTTSADFHDALLNIYQLQHSYS